MRAMHRFKYDREITLWLSGFTGRALPGTCLPDEVDYGIRTLPGGNGRAFELDMSLPVQDGTVDIEVGMTVLTGHEGGPVFGNLVERFDVFTGHTVGLKTIWRQDGRWFVSKSGLKTSRPHSL